MSVVAPVISIALSTVTWSNLHSGDTGGPVANFGLSSPYGSLPFSWRKVQFVVSGIIGAGGALRMEGSTTGNGFLPLQDAVTAWPFFQQGIIWRPCGSLREVYGFENDRSYFYAARLSVIDEVAPPAPEGLQLSNYLRPRVLAGDSTTLLTLVATFTQ